MSLRDVVTGNDACTPDDGAGPSNAFAGLANTLLGTSSKQQERLNELPGFQGLPGASEARFAPQRPEDVALAAAEGEQVPIPGIFPGRARGREQLLPGPPGPSAGALPWHAEFADFQQAWPGPGRQMPGAGPAAMLPAGTPILPLLHAFLTSAKAQARFQPLAAPPDVALSVGEQCRVRDRSTILARHLFAEGGDGFADEQVARLLHSLRIDPSALPSQAPAHADWERIFHGGRPGDSLAVGDAVARQRDATRPDVDGWADQFAQLDLRPEAASGDAMAQEFLQGLGPGGAWADEFRAAATPGSAAAGAAAASGDALQQTRALADTLAGSGDPKMRNSQFLRFLSKMSRGEIILEDNQAKEVPAAARAAAVGDQWAQEHADQAREADLARAWDSLPQGGAGGRGAWSDEFLGEAHPADAWADQFGAERLPEQWAAEYGGAQAGGGSGLAAAAVDGEYVFARDNPFLQDVESLAKGRELFRSGLLSEAVLALEAEVTRSPANVDAWRLLGTVHAENDDDQQAIAALRRALAAEPGNAEVLLSLGVSHVNELDQRRALGFLLDWLRAHPGVPPPPPADALPRDPRERLRAVVDVFRGAAQAAAGDADVHVALGVLCNLARDFDGAVAAFRTALQTRSADYSLWNKLGATLANSGRSGEAIGAYERALDIKPNYMRAWANMGISQANVGEHEQSARFYVRALGLNPRAANVWGYLRTSLTCAGRADLLAAVEESDLQQLAAALPL